MGSQLGSSGSFSANAWTTVDVTSYITGNGTYNFAFSTTSSTNVSYSSREGANAPQLVIETSTGATNTPTATNTPGPTSTPTRTPTSAGTNTPTVPPTATPTTQPTFQNATFIYDGDGKRVKSIINNAIITYFVGIHYEVTGSTITKYYYAGAQRIAMRTGTTLSYLLSDHLGSTSLVTDATGNNSIETRYKAWGEVRFASGPTPTDYTYTGQFSYVDDFGLLFYNARWYDPVLGRFAQADTILPGGVQENDRYAYVSNNPIKLTDPSGHKCVGKADECLNIFNKPMNGSGRTTSWINPVAPMVRGGGLDFGNNHPGVDLNPDSNDNLNPEIVTSSAGVVYSSTACTIDPCFNSDGVDANDGYGNVVIIGYDYGALPSEIKQNIPEGSTLFVLYAHLEAPSSLEEGDIVIPGQIIGNVGNTGASDGTHLHMEIRIEGNFSLPVGDIHNEEGYTDVHRTWHNLLNPLNPHDFFDIP